MMSISMTMTMLEKAERVSGSILVYFFLFFSFFSFLPREEGGAYYEFNTRSVSGI